MATPLQPPRLACLALLLLCVLAVPRPARAQATAADTAAILLDAAGRLEREGRGDAAAALLDYIRVHYATTAAAGEAASRLARRPPSESPMRRAFRGPGGRTELMVWGTTYGIWAGLAMPHALGADNKSAYGLGLLLGAPAGLLISRAYASHVNLTEGAARSITFGGSWGTWHGYGVPKLLGLLDHTEHICYQPPGAPQSCYDHKSTSSKAVIRSMLLGGIAGIGAGALVGQRNEVSPGTATASNLAALWGTGYGAGAALLFDMHGKGPLALAVLGGDAALLAEAAIAPRSRISRERARLISVAGLAGGLAGLGVDVLLGVEDEAVAVGIPMVGSTLGLLIGSAATRKMPREEASNAGGAPGGGALLNVRDGHLGLGVPAVSPLLASARTRGMDSGATILVPVLSARF
jgi:hypothetical protein